MSDQSEDRIEGKFEEIKGRGKSALGGLSNDDQMKSEGDVDQIAGKAKQGVADLKDKADAAVKKVTGSGR
jgi:uncharacterized protein YjbJ (UPF0337 family)